MDLKQFGRVVLKAMEIPRSNRGARARNAHQATRSREPRFAPRAGHSPPACLKGPILKSGGTRLERQLASCVTMRIASAIEKAGGKCEYCGKNAATQGDHAKTLNTYKIEVNEGKMTAAEAKTEANGSGNVVGSCKQCNEVDKHTRDLGSGPGQYTPPNPSPRVKDMLEP